MKKKCANAGCKRLGMALMMCILALTGCGSRESDDGASQAVMGGRTERSGDEQTGAGTGKQQNGAIAEDSAEGGQQEETSLSVTEGEPEPGEEPLADGAGTAGDGEGEMAVLDLEPEPKNLFAYERKAEEDGEYLVITGLSEEWEEYLAKYEKVSGKGEEVCLAVCIPEKIDGITVKEIGEDAFAGKKIADLELPATVEVIADGAFRNTGCSFSMDGWGSQCFPENLKEIGTEAFENCAFEKVEFPDRPVHVGGRAFAGNKNLWAVFAKDVGTVLEDDALEGCREAFLLCYGENPQGKENLVRAYAQENGLDSTEIILSKEPVVRYPEEPLVLYPEVRNFFYGDFYDGGQDIYQAFYEEQWCSFEEDEQAPNFGYSDWQWPGCSSWCAMIDFEQEAEASSELESFTGRYAAENVLRQDRYGAWAEGAEGMGIGESITYRQSCTYPTDNKWEVLRWDFREPEKRNCDGFMRYSEICIVNGYAKDQKTWEENGRVKRLLMYVAGKPYAFLELEDTILPQYFLLPEDDIKVLNGGMIEFRFEIEDVYAGTVYEDTCLTGIVMEFTGRHSH